MNTLLAFVSLEGGQVVFQPGVLAGFILGVVVSGIVAGSIIVVLIWGSVWIYKALLTSRVAVTAWGAWTAYKALRKDK
jgi:hypothetical protein